MYAKGSGEKRQRQSERRRLRNRIVRSAVRTEARKFYEAFAAKDKDKAAATFQNFEKLIDTAADKGVFPKRTAARKKSRLNLKLNSL